MDFDIIIRRGMIADGTGAATYPNDVGIRGDTIAAIGDLSAARASRSIDALGLIVAPGFIDPHNHANDETAGGALAIPKADNSLRQGVTTLVTGNCGGSSWPVAEYLSHLEQVPIRQNHAMLVGLGTLRAQAGVSSSKPATAEQVAAMRTLAARAMDEGALGMSTGYFPAHVTIDEICSVAEAVAQRGGIYASHIRNEADGLLGALEEIVEIGARCRMPVQVSHIKTYGRRNWYKIDAALALLEHALERGVDIAADRYPYSACFTGISSLLPAWMRNEAHARGGWDSLIDPAWAPRVREAVADSFHLIGGPHNVLLAPMDPHPDLDGKRLDEYAAETESDPADAAIDLIRQGGVSCIYFTMSEDNIETFYRHPQVMGGSDGHLRVLGEGVSHPRNYGTFPRIIGHYGRDRGLFGVEEAVRKCTSIAAGRFGLSRRGVLAKGNVADVVVFDWKRIKDMATFEDQHLYPEGVQWVIVNGNVAVEDGKTARGSYGRVVRRGDNT